MSGLRAPRKGMSYVDANRGRLITVKSDVLDIKAQIEERWPGVFDVYFDEVDERWVIVEHCEDGQDRLFGTSDRLDQRLLDRIHKADQRRPGYVDFLDEIDAHNDRVQKDRDEKLSDQIGDFGERFIHALKKDGIFNHDNIFGR